MIYYEYKVTGTMEQDLILGLLSAWPFESFMEIENGVLAYISEKDQIPDLQTQMEESLSGFDLKFTVNSIQPENWNKQWESNFKPVIIDDFCVIRADFHKDYFSASHQITINPKMAFGTGHHETTWMMINAMSKIEFADREVFDYGTGTAVLAILARKMGASKVYGIDYDPNSIENSWENIHANKVDNIHVEKAELKAVEPYEYDVVLANINVPVLIDNVDRLARFVKTGGVLLLSGIMNIYTDRILSCYESVGFSLKQSLSKGEWSCLKFQKK